MAVPGPVALGRGVVILPGAALPAPWVVAPLVVVDEGAMVDPAATVETLHRHWSVRQPVVVELAVDPARFREPESLKVEPWRLPPTAEPWFDRLHHLVWSNNYDARGGVPVWWWGRKAARLGATETPEGPADVLLADGTAAWIDGGPRSAFASGELGGHHLVHRESVERGALRVAPEPVPPSADLADDQMAAVAHRSGPARVIAPAGSGKTRVLTERLRHLLGDRGWESEAVLAVAYNKEAQLELERRGASLAPQVRTLNSLGHLVLREHAGRAPMLAGERDCRRLVESLLPGRRQRRANTDPIGPYLEALGAVRLGLRDPAEVEAERDDVDGLTEIFEPYRQALARKGMVDFDEQVYRAIEVLLSDGPFRRGMQQRCGHLLVDEFQDLTPAHVLLVRLLALPGLDVFGVGDDDQVIYGHQSADPGFLIDYDGLFGTSASHPLTVNYRCPVAVVEATGRLLSHNFRRVSKEVHSGPDAERSADALRVITHRNDTAAETVVGVLRGWFDEGAVPSDTAVLARVNSLLLAPQIALGEAGVPVRSALGPEVLERTGMRAALAYLRLATSGACNLAASDVLEVLRRPTRGLPQWFPDRLQRRSTWSIAQVRAIADQVPEKEAAKVGRLADDLEVVVEAARGGTTRRVLEVVRDDVGLGSAMGMLDRSGAGQGSSHLDDLDALSAVADLHPDPSGFEEWLRGCFGRATDRDGVTLSSIHRVKGREWDRVVVFGVQEGVMPHRLSTDVEEERRVFYVGATRGRDRVAVLADAGRPSRFLAELAGTAPRRTERTRTDGEPGRLRRRQRVASADAAEDSTPASLGLRVKVLGGYEGAILVAAGRDVVVRLDGGGTLRVRYGERVEVAGRKVVLSRPVELWGAAAEAETVLRQWRAEQAKAAGKPAYVFLSDAHLRGIALARPRNAEELIGCDGIGPAKLDRYGDEILARLDLVDG